MQKNIIFLVSLLSVSAMQASDYGSTYQKMDTNESRKPLAYDDLMKHSTSQKRYEALDDELKAEYKAVSIPLKAEQMAQAIKDLDEDCTCCYCTYVPKFAGLSKKLIETKNIEYVDTFNSPALHDARKTKTCVDRLAQPILSPDGATSCIAQFAQDLNLLRIDGHAPVYALLRNDFVESYPVSYNHVESPYRVQVLDQAVQRGMDLTKRVDNGNNALHVASITSLCLTKAFVKHLKAKGQLAQLLEQKNNKGETPLTHFVNSDLSNLPKYKIVEGSVVPVKKPRSMAIPLFLLNQGACADAQDNKGNSFAKVSKTSLEFKLILALHQQEKMSALLQNSNSSTQNQ